MMLLAVFFSLALEPAARAAQRRWGWSRGWSVAVVLGGGLLALILLVVLLMPGLVELADRIGAQGPGWIDSLNAWTQDQFDVSIVDQVTAAAGLRQSTSRSGPGPGKRSAP
jgi:predicted PurR-regulated permease PerM